MAATPRKVFELFVNKIPWTLASRELREYFEQFGRVRSCTVPFNTKTGFHNGHCWISFVSEEEMNHALQKDPHIIEGAQVQVQRNTRPFSAQIRQ